VLKGIQHAVAILALLFGWIAGPETHVHPGEGLHYEIVVHTHIGNPEHVHNPRSGLGESGEGPAKYINSYNVVSGSAVQLLLPHAASRVFAAPILQPSFERVIFRLFSDAPAPPNIEFAPLRAPPLSTPCA
jgi:hypothetical protein